MMPELSHQQLWALESLAWIYDASDAARGSGRSTAVAIALIRAALRSPGQEINIVDHYANSRLATRFLVTLVIDFLHSDPMLQLSFNPSQTQLTHRLRIYPDLLPRSINPDEWLPAHWTRPTTGALDAVPLAKQATAPEPGPELTLWDYVQDPTR